MKKITTVTREYDGNGRVIKEIQVEETVEPTYPGTYVSPTPNLPPNLPYRVWCSNDTLGGSFQ